FDVSATPARVGALAEVVRQLPGAQRSTHPVASVVALGPRAAEIVAGHDRCASPFGAGSPYETMMSLEPKLLLVGAHLGGLLYHVQDRVDFPNLYDKLPREFEVRDGEGHYRKMSTVTLRAIPSVVILPGSRPENRDYLLVPDYALMFPVDREKQVM